MSAAEQVKDVSLSRDLSEFLIELSISVHRYAIYPRTHPSLASAASDLSARLLQLLRGRESIALGVAQDQLVIDGIATDRKNPVLIDLARRLHGHQLGALTFSRGFDQASVQGLLEALAVEQDPEAAPIGLLPDRERPSWPGIRLAPVGYEDLEIEDDADAAGNRSALALWIGLARAAVADSQEDEDDRVPDADEVAKSIRDVNRDRAYDQVIIGYLLQLSDELGRGDDGHDAVRHNVSRLVEKLDKTTLARILEMGGDLEARRQFLKSALKSLPSVAVIRLLDGAADASGATISRSLTMLLTKLARHADAEDAVRATEGGVHLSEHVDRMLHNWELDDPNPDQYTQVLQELSRLRGGEGADVVGPAVSLIQMSIEVDRYGESVEKGLVDLVEAGALPKIAPIIMDAVDSEAAGRMRERLSDPAIIINLADRADVDPASLELLTGFVDPQVAAASLVELVLEAEAEGVRTKALNRLVELRDHLGDELAMLLESEVPDVIRAGMEIVRQTGRKPQRFAPTDFLGHPDSGVRRVALGLALEEPETRLVALAEALRGGDHALQGTALEMIAADPPATLIPIVVDQLLRKPDVPPWLTRMAVHTLSMSDSDMARRGLLDLVVARRTWLGRPKIARGTRSVLEALEALTRFQHDPEVAGVLKVALKSRDESVRRAAGVRSKP